MILLWKEVERGMARVLDAYIQGCYLDIYTEGGRLKERISFSEGTITRLEPAKPMYRINKGDAVKYEV